MLAVVAFAAQDPPDFSGRWFLASSGQSGPDTPKALSVRQALVRTTVSGEAIRPFFKDIAVDREFESGIRSETSSIGVVGGVVPGLRAGGQPDGRRAHHAVKWDGDTLVFERGSYGGETPESGEWFERREVWSLDPDGRLRVTLTTRGSTAAARTVTQIYRRP